MTGPNRLEQDLEQIRTEGALFWEDLRGARIFVTGGTGFFGSWILESFSFLNRELDLGAEMTVLTRDPAAFQAKAPHLAGDPAIRFHSGDVRRFDFPEGKFTHLIHAATPVLSRENQKNPALMVATIIEGTRHTLEFAKQAGVRKFLLTSSGAVYGRQPPDVPFLKETHPGSASATIFSYGDGKRKAEEMLCESATESGFDALIARCFAFVGPYQPLNSGFAVADFIGSCLKDAPITIGGDGTPYRSYLYASDLVVWLWAVLLRGKSGQPYNVGSEERITIAELARKVVSVLKPETPVRIMKTADLSVPPEQYIPSTERARAELGVRQAVSLTEAIEKTAQWHSEEATRAS